MANKSRGLIGNGGLAAALLLAASPLPAQDNSSAADPAAAAPATADIGPRELSNFTLNGTVTREAQPQTQPAASPPAATTAARQPESRQPASGETSSGRLAQVRPMAVEPRPAQPQSRGVLDPIPGAAASPAVAARPQTVSPPVPAALPAQASGFSPLPWIAALLLVAAAAAIYFGLQRRARNYAAAGSEQDFVAAAQPAPEPLPRDTAPAPLVRRPAQEAPAVPAGLVTSSLRAAREAPAPSGVVASSLRPWIELELEPSQAMLTDDHAAIAFDVTIFNSGSAPARDVAVEACMINAGAQQDAQLGEFYTAPSQVRDKIPAVAPMARVTLKSAVRLPRASVQEYEVEGRKLFMPMVALNSRYRWSSGEGQSAASFLVGGRAANERARLSPLRLDQGKRGWKALAARRYEKGIRL